MPTKEYMKAWNAKNPGKQAEYRHKWQQANKLQLNFYRQERRKRCPWIRTYETIHNRIRQAKNGRYRQRAYTNVRMLMTPSDLKELWIRDKAELLKSPSIDRKDSKGDYTKDNCRYIELLENRARVENPGPNKKTALPLDN